MHMAFYFSLSKGFGPSDALARHKAHKRHVQKAEAGAFGSKQGGTEPLSDFATAEIDVSLPPHPEDKTAMESWKDTRGKNGGPCTEAGFCGNLKPLDSGDPHPNCNAWKKDCPCMCVKHRPKPSRVINTLKGLLEEGASPLPYAPFGQVSGRANAGKIGRGTAQKLGSGRVGHDCQL
jgi:hypothetical protein